MYQIFSDEASTDGPRPLADVLGYADDDICYGTDRVDGAGPVPAVLALMDFGAVDGNSRYVALGTPWGDWNPVTSDEDVPPGQPHARNGLYLAPHLSSDEALAVAVHLDDLADLADAGYQSPEPTRYSRAAHRLQHLIEADQAELDELITVGDDVEFPLTVRELLTILRDKDPVGAASNTRRRVVASNRGEAEGVTGVVWMDLHQSHDGVLLVAVTGVEGETAGPDDRRWSQYTSVLTPDSARTLAAKVRVFAEAARMR